MGPLGLFLKGTLLWGINFAIIDCFFVPNFRYRFVLLEFISKRIAITKSDVLKKKVVEGKSSLSN